MKYLFLILLIPYGALAHTDEAQCGGLCRCTFEERLPDWIRFHDEYWGCFDGFRQQQVEYGRCLGAVRECERKLTKRQRRKYSNYIENPNIINYPFQQHPIESAGNNVPFAEATAKACQIQLGSQIIPSVLQCSAHYQWCKTVK